MEISCAGDEIMYASMVPSSVNPSVQHLDAMAKVLDEVGFSQTFNTEFWSFKFFGISCFLFFYFFLLVFAMLLDALIV